jgi:hypothetical protein
MTVDSKGTILLIAALMFCIVSIASASDADVVPFSDKFPVMISVTDHADVYRVARLGVDIDAVGEGWVRAYVNEAEVEALESLGFAVERIPNQALRMWRSLQEAGDLGTKDVYHDYDALTTYLQTVAADHPAITELISIGHSVQGRELWFLKISDNPEMEEDEPEFKYISTMHGDEPVGTENCLKCIDLLTDNYDLPDPDEDLKRLVDDVEIWIMPMMNPDGNAAGSRYNANGVDLNRSFPDWFEDPDNTPEGRQPETGAVMVFSDSMAFDLSANFHTGALVVNYVWDNRPELAPDDSLFIAASEAYSINNRPMWNSLSFYHGITNGYAWYEAHGTMQDWNYEWMYDMEVTIELYDTKWPPASQLPQLWDDNEEAMVAYLEYCLRGVRGIVTDSLTGDPLAAVVQVDGIAWDDHTDPDVGDYHRILKPGTYTIAFSSPGYVTKRISGIGVGAGAATVVDVELVPAPLVSVSGTVTADSHAPVEARLEFRYHPEGGLAESLTTDPLDGSYATMLSAAEYDIDVRAEGYVPQHLFADVEGDTTFDFELTPTAGVILVVTDGTGAGTDIASDLEFIGFDVVEESAAETEPGTWNSYPLMVWSSGGNTSPVGSSAYRRDLLDYVGAGGHLLIEGGELAYDAVSSPGYSNFADSVLHSDAWDGDDVGDLSLAAGQTTHPIATSPNVLPGTMAVTYTGWGSEDAAHPAGDAYIVYGTASHSSDAGVLVFDGGAPPGKGQVVFYAFAYSDLSDADVARHLLENTVAYLTNEAAVEGSGNDLPVAGLSAARPNPFRTRTEILYSLRSGGEVSLAVYDIRGRLIRSLAKGHKAPGPYRAVWLGDDSHDAEVSPGVYFLRLVTPCHAQTRKVIKID